MTKIHFKFMETGLQRRAGLEILIHDHPKDYVVLLLPSTSTQRRAKRPGYFLMESHRNFKELMKSMKTESLSLAELSKKYKERKREFEADRLALAQEIYVEFSAIAQLMGVSFRQIAERSLKPGDKPLRVRYVNPANVSQQWHGRGAKPKWLREWLAAGKSLDYVRF